MASNTLTKKSDLAAQVLRIIKRTGVTAFSDEMNNVITLAEAELNDELGPVETDSSLVGVSSSRVIDISSISLVKPVALFLVPTTGTETELQQQADGTFPYRVDTGCPHIWAIDGTNINFDCPLDSAYAFRFRNVQRFALVNDADTNWLLTNNPNVYLAACVKWAYARMEDTTNAAQWGSELDSLIPKARRKLTQMRRGTLRVDPALSSIGRNWPFNYTTGQ